MEPIAVNETLMTKKYFFEAMTAADNYRESALKGLGVMALAWVVLAAVTLWLGMSFGIALMELFVISAVGVWLVLLYPRNRYRRAYNSMVLKNDGYMERTVRFYRDKLTIETHSGTGEFRYYDIIRIRKTKNLMVLLTVDKVGLMFSLDGFTKGDTDTVQKAIKAITQ